MKKRNLDTFLAKVGNEVHWKHLALVGGFATVLLVILSVRGDISLNPFRAQAETGKTLTYEEAKALVAQEMGASASSNSEAIKNQLALVDPNAGEPGQVLGLTTDLNISDPIEQVLPQAELDQIKLITTTDNSVDSFNRYATQVVHIEAKNNMIGVLTALDSDDPSKLAEVKALTNQMIGMMKGIEVPTELVEYHKLKLIYYASLGQIGQSFIGIGDMKLDDVTRVMLSIMDRLGAIKLDIYNRYQIVL